MDNNNLFDKDNLNQNQNQSSEQGQFQQPYQQQTTYQQSAYQQPYQQPYQQSYQQQQPYQSGDSDLEEPVSFADWMVTTLIMCIPCVNIVMLFVWAFGSGTKKSKANYCKAMLVWMVIGVVLSFVLGGVFMALIASIMQEQGVYY